MKAYVDCIPCFLRQALEAARMATDDEEVHKEVLRKVMEYLSSESLDKTPAELSKKAHSIVKEITNCDDPYLKAKQRDNETAKRLYPKVKRMITSSADPLLTAIKLAIAGNIIDLGVSSSYDVERTMTNVLKTDFAIDEYKSLKKDLNKAEQVLYIGDNAGEIFFDKSLMEYLLELGKKIVYAVRDEPIINDVTVEDAEFAGIEDVAKVITAGGGASGAVLDLCSPEFVECLRNAEVVISKGQGNYESLSEEQIYFLLIVKCKPIAKDLGVKVGDLVLKKGGKAIKLEGSTKHPQRCFNVQK
jgi:hypothetical protein